MRALRFHVLLVAASTSFASPALASWTPMAVAQAPGAQYAPVATTDGSGGAIVAWYDDRSGTGAIYVHHVLTSDAADPTWPANGLSVGVASDFPAIVSDGTGGAIVAWASGPGYDVYAHHVLASGVLDPAWPAGGALLCTAPDNQIGVRAVSDEAGGAIVTWGDNRNALTSDWDIYAQRVLSTGAVDSAWPANGLGVCTAAFAQVVPAAVSDGGGGIIIAWEDNRNGTDADIFAQRILPSSAVAPGWPAGGKQLTGAADSQYGPRACPDGAGGAIVAWSDFRSGTDYDVLAMRVRDTGALGQAWKPNGEVLSDATGDQELSDLAADGSGGAITVWNDQRAGPSTYDVYVQKVTASGAVSWTADGIPVCAAANSQTFPTIASDGAGGAFVTWQDRRHEVVPFFVELYLHHVLASGAPDPGWPADGGRVTYGGTVGINASPALLATGSGGATVAWDAGSVDLFAMNVTSTWTPPLPVSVAVAPSGSGSVTRSPDLPSYGQGSQVTLTANPATGYGLTTWSGDATGSTNPLIVTVDAPKNITANFATRVLTVAVSPTGSGTVTKDPNLPSYPPGTSVSLTATPVIGYAFGSWSGDATGSTNPLIVTMDADRSITANFTPVTDVEDLPAAFAMGRIHPNPSAGAAKIEYSLARQARVRLQVLDVTGREVVRLVDGLKPTGRHVATWTGTVAGTRVRSGIYLARFETPWGASIQRIVMLR